MKNTKVRFNIETENTGSSFDFPYLEDDYYGLIIFDSEGNYDQEKISKVEYLELKDTIAKKREEFARKYPNATI